MKWPWTSHQKPIVRKPETPTSETSPERGIDSPLQADTALKTDRLGRKAFAASVVASLRRVTPSAGLVISIEGGWGSGKTSTLALVEALLEELPEDRRPVIVHFNPWLVGERDALLRQFLSEVSASVRLREYAEDGHDVAKALTAYAKLFELVRLVPGAEPWATMVKDVLGAAGAGAKSVAGHHALGLNAHKRRLEAALREFPRPIIVFIDDIDRLYPQEVFEIIRIVKAVGDLPNIGYVLAWDPNYVGEALDKVGVPFPRAYPDKIVQLRLPIPPLPYSVRRKGLDEMIAGLETEARAPYFRGGDELLADIEGSGILEIMEQPRDFARISEALRTIEPRLRGEVVLADIVVLVVLMVKAPPVFELIRQRPEWFASSSNDRQRQRSPRNEEATSPEAQARSRAYEACAHPDLVMLVVHALFAEVHEHEDGYSEGWGRDLVEHGRIRDGDVLKVALQMQVSGESVSLVAARTYLRRPESRKEILENLNPENCLDFIRMIGMYSKEIGESEESMLRTCLLVAETVDCPEFQRHARAFDSYSLAEQAACQAIRSVIGITADYPLARSILAEIVASPACITVSRYLIHRSYSTSSNWGERIPKLSSDEKSAAIPAFVNSARQAIAEGYLQAGYRPDALIETLAVHAAAECRAVFDAISASPEALDAFAVIVSRKGIGVHTRIGETLPSQHELAEFCLFRFCSRADFVWHAHDRLDDVDLGEEAGATWRRILEVYDSRP